MTRLYTEAELAQIVSAGLDDAALAKLPHEDLPQAAGVSYASPAPRPSFNLPWGKIQIEHEPRTETLSESICVDIFLNVVLGDRDQEAHLSDAFMHQMDFPQAPAGFGVDVDTSLPLCCATISCFAGYGDGDTPTTKPLDRSAVAQYLAGIFAAGVIGEAAEFALQFADA